MAGIKITDLTALASAEAADYLCIVDVSDTSSSPEGTTKKIEVANIIPVVPTIASGTWAPTLGDFTNCVTDASAISAYYSRVDNIVTATIYASVDLDFSLGSGAGYCDYDLPIATASIERIGIGQLFSKSVNCNIASNSSKIRFDSTSSSNIGATSFTFTFQYEIN